MTAESTRVLESTGIQSQPPNQPVPFAPVKTTDEENKKAAAAAVAAKLAASTSSAQMLTSVLSSLVAEEAASMFSPEKRQKLEKSMSVSDVSNADVGSAAYFTPLQQQTMTSGPLAPSTSMQTMSQANQMQIPFGPPPPPPAPSPSSASNQYVQTAGVMMGVMPYGYGSNNLPPPPPMPPHISMGLSRATQPQQQSLPQQQQQQQQQQVQPATGGYYRPLGMGFYGQSNQSASQPVPRQ